MSDLPAATGAFELSRAYGKGWKAAKHLLACAKGDIDAGEVAALNPHCTPDERARWAQGFAEAVRSSNAAVPKWDGNAWRSRAR